MDTKKYFILWVCLSVFLSALVCFANWFAFDSITSSTFLLILTIATFPIFFICFFGVISCLLVIIQFGYTINKICPIALLFEIFVIVEALFLAIFCGDIVIQIISAIILLISIVCFIVTGWIGKNMDEA